MTQPTKICPTKIKIIKLANSMFFMDGFTQTTARKIAEKLGISTGNLTFHFPTKEHLLLELVREMCELQWETTLGYVEEGTPPLLAYALEITVQTAICNFDETMRDIYTAAYTIPITLAEIREWDSKKAKKLFFEYNPDWCDHDYVLAENNASGIELAALMTECNEELSLDDKIASTLDSLMRLYNVPEKERVDTINYVLSMDYMSISEDILEKFRQSIIN